MQWATLNSCLSTHLSIHASAVCLSTVFLRAPSTPESKGPGQTESNQPPPAVNAAVSGPPPRAPLEGLLSLCPSASAQGGGCAQTLRVQRAQEHGRPGPWSSSSQAVEGDDKRPASCPLATVGAGTCAALSGPPGSGPEVPAGPPAHRLPAALLSWFPLLTRCLLLRSAPHPRPHPAS